MSLNFGSTLRICGIVMVVIGIAMLPSFFVSLIYREYICAFTFGACICVFLILGLISSKIPKYNYSKLNVRDGYFTLTLSWMLAAILGAIPFFASGYIPSIIDAIFESCSGFTTTGASILSDVESLPHAILFWRSFTQWLGGLSILLFAIAFIPTLGISGQDIIVNETSGPMLNKISPSVDSTSRIIITIYLSLTLVEIILLLPSGMGLFDSLIQTFGSVGTGGFSNYNDSIAHFNSNYVKIVIAIFMFFGGTNFNLFILPRKKGLRIIKNDIEIRYYIGLIVFGSLMTTAVLILAREYGNNGGNIVDAIFQTISFVSTTGFTSAEYYKWPVACTALFLGFMIIGSCTSSTGSGLKVLRVVLTIKLITRGISMRLHPHAFHQSRLSGKTMPSDTLSGIANYIFLYIALILFGSFLISFENIDISSCLTSTIACLSNVGVGFSNTQNPIDFGSMSGFSKMVLSIFMVGGRLELYSLFVLINPKFWDTHR